MKLDSDDQTKTSEHRLCTRCSSTVENDDDESDQRVPCIRSIDARSESYLGSGGWSKSGQTLGEFQ
jgi:hypothetical protein